MTFDNTNRKNIRTAEKAARLAESNRIAYTKTIMSNLFGRAWMYDLLFRCNVFHTPFVAGAPDITSFNCGKQNVGLQIFGDVAAHCPHEYTLMMQEASIKDEVENVRHDSQSASDSATGSEPGRNGYVDQPSGYSVDREGFVTYPDTGAEDTRTDA